MSEDPQNDFESASSEKQRGIVTEFILFLRKNKKFWLIPLLLMLLVLGLLVTLGSTAAAPFIYTLF